MRILMIINCSVIEKKLATNTMLTLFWTTPWSNLLWTGGIFINSYFKLCRARKLGVWVQTLINPKNMAMYWTLFHIETRFLSASITQFVSRSVFRSIPKNFFTITCIIWWMTLTYRILTWLIWWRIRRRRGREREEGRRRGGEEKKEEEEGITQSQNKV